MRKSLIVVAALCTCSVPAFGFYYQGWLDVADCGSFAGWAWDAETPNTPISVDIYDGTILIATVLAGTYRPDLQAAGFGNGYHGFVLLTPPILKDGKPHSIRAQAAGTALLLETGVAAINPINCSAGGYQYYYTDALTSIDPNKWTQNGTLSATPTGLTSATTNGGSLISKVAIPDGTAEYEVSATLNLQQSGGTYAVFMRATTDAQSGPGTRGTYYVAELQNPIVSAAACTATLAIYKRINGVVTALASTTVVCAPTTTIRMTRNAAAWIEVFVNRLLYTLNSASEITSGMPGIGVRGAPAANTISLVQLGPQDRVAPSPVNASSIAVSALPNRIDFQWQGAADDPNGTGVATYEVDRADVGFNAQSNLPHYTDTTVQPGTTYTYTIYTRDYHYNVAGRTFTVTTPPAGTVDARRVGVRPTGSYWGGLGENIDLLSGNLNFTLPLLKAQGRGGMSLPINLSYNSEQWRKDSGGTWNLGTDVGYGYGWKLLAGSITPYYAPGWLSIDHYLFTDSSGAEYRLDQKSGNLWTSKESIYVTYDANARRLYFNDGTFWLMGCTSAGTEEEAGTMYPTLVQDSNGNQILIRYQPGLGVTWRDSSARIWQIEDVRAKPGPADPTSYWTYDFEYDTSPGLPHLLRITNNIGTSEAYTLTTTGLQSLLSPFDGTNLDSTYFLQSVTIAGLNLTYQFTSSTAGELTKVTFPYGGYERWDYGNYQYANGRLQTEVSQRYLSKDGASETTYRIGRDAGDPSRQVHYYADLWDPDQQSEKPWFFNTSGPYIGLIWLYQERQLPGQMAIQHLSYTWSTDLGGNPYISSVVTTLELDTANQIQKQVSQSKDAFGNILTMQLYDWKNLTTPARTYSNMYITDPAKDPTYSYRNSYIRNRLVSSTLTSGTQTITLLTNWYDNSFGSGLSDPGPLRDHDPAYNTNFVYRGNVVRRTDLAGTTNIAYDTAGNAVSVTTPAGVVVTGSYQSSTNFAAPSSITTNTLANTLQWSSFLGLNQNTGPNGDSASTVYDAYARPASTTSPTGAVTTYTYSTTAPWTETATVNGRWTRKTLDGFGRPVLIETGNGSTTVSQVDMLYGSCACSPIGKLKQQSLPHPPGATPQYVVYNYDGLGRTVSVVQPDGSSKRYEYSANTVKVTDEADKWKKYTMDAFGNITQVLEPDPDSSSGATYTTTYAYDQLNHLTTVTMPRPSGTQTRTFNYGNPPGAFLLSATNPENGTVTYTYGAGGTLATKTDAKNQQIRYTYDSYLRLTRLGYYQTPTSQEDTQARVDIYYDTAYAGPSTNMLGRMTWKQYTVAASPSPYTFRETYGYTQPGQLSSRTLQILYGSYSTSLAQSWTYDNEGRVTSVVYPTAGVKVDGTNSRAQSYSYGYDIMGRLSTMQSTVSPNPATNVVTGTTYGPAGELLTISFAGRPAETRTYNSLLQLTGLNESTFAYPTGHNNGRIQSETNSTTGEQVTYAYDALNRLISAVTSDNPNVTQWGQQFVYDGFGNLREKNLIKGSAPTLSVLVDAATNRLPLYQYDPKGNQLTTNTQTLTYNYENRLSHATAGNNSSTDYSYDADGRRVYSKDILNFTVTERVYIYGLGNELIATYLLKGVPNSLYMVLEAHRGYFGGRLTEQGSNNFTTYTVTAVTPNRLGSVGKNYPYGENGSTGTIFATYTRDSGGLDYALHRDYYSVTGRFTSPDPFPASSLLLNPSSFNRYAYVEGDPTNRNDPRGLCTVMIGGATQTPYTPGTTSQQDVARAIGAISAFPYAGGNPGSDIASIMAQGVGIPTGATRIALNAIALAAQNSGPIDIIAYSGGAAAFASAWKYLSPNVQQRIASITYIDPGSSPNQSLQGGNPGTNIDVYGDQSDLTNIALRLVGGPQPLSQNSYNTGRCGHNANCVFANYFNQIEFGKSACSIGAGAVFGAPMLQPPRNIIPAAPGSPWSIFGSFMLSSYWNLEPVPVVSSGVTKYFLEP